MRPRMFEYADQSSDANIFISKERLECLARTPRLREETRRVDQHVPKAVPVSFDTGLSMRPWSERLCQDNGVGTFARFLVYDPCST